MEGTVAGNAPCLVLLGGAIPRIRSILSPCLIYLVSLTCQVEQLTSLRFGRFEPSLGLTIDLLCLYKVMNVL